MHTAGRLANVVATVDKVFTDSDVPAEAVVLSKLGSDSASTNCESLTLDYKNGEYLSSLDMTWLVSDSAARQIVFTTNKGAKLSKGTVD